MMAYITKTRTSNLYILNSVNLTIHGEVAKLNSAYILTSRVAKLAEALINNDALRIHLHYTCMST